MSDQNRGWKSTFRLAAILPALAVSATMLGAGSASADEPVPPLPAAVPMPPPPAPPPMPPPPPVVVAPPMDAPPPPKPATAAESMPASRPDALPPIDVGAWTRISGIFQNPNDNKKINDWHMNNEYVELHAGGKIHKNVGVTLNLNANMVDFSTAGASAVTIEDAIISFDFDDAFHVWVGHLLVPVDRANASGPFFMIPWNYPGLAGAGPMEGPSGRNNGAVVWGDISGGKLTYLAGTFDNAAVGTSPLFSGRLRLALWDPEPGFWGNASFFGDKDMLSLGVGGQFQKHGSAARTAAGVITTDKDYADVNADLLVEKKIPGGGWVTGEGAYYHFNVLDSKVSDYLYVLAAYATPTVGVGNIQPMVRYQWEKIKSGAGTNPYNIDAALSYLIKGPALRVVATYSYNKINSSTTANAIQLGAQAIFF